MQGCAPSVKLQMSIVINIHEEIRPNFTYTVLSTQLTSTPNLVKISSLLTEIWPVAIFDQPVRCATRFAVVLQCCFGLHGSRSRTGRRKACVSCTTPYSCCGSCLLIRSGSAMFYGLPLRWRSSVPPRVGWCYLRRDRLRISLDILRSVRCTQVSGMGHSSFYTHEECSFGRLFVGRSRTGHSIRLWRGCSPRLHRADMRTAPSLPSSG